MADIAASFQKAAVDILVENTIRAYEADPCGKIALAGGVAANSLLRASLKAAAEAAGASFYCPAPVLCTDNGAMIACAAYYAWQKGRTADLSLNAYANRSIEDLNG